MKRFLSVILVIAMVCVSTLAFAEGKDGVLGRIGGFIDNVASGAGDVIDKAGNAAGSIIDRAGDTVNSAGDAIGRAKDAAGDAVGNAGQAISDLWSSAGDTAGNAWTQISEFASEKGSNIAQAATDVIGDLHAWVDANGANTLELLHTAFNGMAEKLGMAAKTAAELWTAVLNYAAERNISPVVIVKLSLAVMAKLYLGRLSKTIDSMAEAEIRADVKTVIGWFTDNQIVSELAAQNALKLLRSYLK